MWPTMLLPVMLLMVSASVSAIDIRYRGRLYIQSTSRELPLYAVPELPLNPSEPRNIHLAFGRTERDLTVTWSTLVDVRPSLVRYRQIEPAPPSPWLTVAGVSTKFVDGGIARAAQFVHRVTVSGLFPACRYEYQVGSGNWSSRDDALVLDFRVPDSRDQSRSLAVFGDFGLRNAQSLPRLLDDAVTRRLYDAIVHVGDFAYDMPDENGTVGDRFMQMLQPIAGRVQYMTCVGNHEHKYNFSHYKARFSMPGWETGRRMYYSVNIGPVHLVSISNEFYFFTNYGSAQLARQYRWLEADLAVANQNRSSAPWIVLIGHRPMYCSNNGTRDCVWGARTLRDGIRGRWALEPLMLRYGVDLAFWGHEHSYERTLPVAGGRVVPQGVGSDPYVNPRAPVHVITGSAGNKEKHAYFTDSVPAFSAFRSTDYGYTRIRFHNSTHAFLEQVSDDRAGQVIDSLALVQTRHGPFSDFR